MCPLFGIRSLPDVKIRNVACCGRPRLAQDMGVFENKNAKLMCKA